MTEKTIMAATAADPIEAAKKLFGEHPEDVISHIRTAADALGWLEEIFITIARESMSQNNGVRLRKLAELGAYLAFDMANLTDCRHEEMLGRLIEAGAAPAHTMRAAVKGGAA